jgi:hypothetical protein
LQKKKVYVVVPKEGRKEGRRRRSKDNNLEVFDE